MRIIHEERRKWPRRLEFDPCFLLQSIPGQVSDFDKGRLVGIAEVGASATDMLQRLQIQRIIVMRWWNHFQNSRQTKRRNWLSEKWDKRSFLHVKTGIPFLGKNATASLLSLLFTHDGACLIWNRQGTQTGVPPRARLIRPHFQRRTRLCSPFLREMVVVD